MDASEKKPRGFAALSPERLREISSKGGRRAVELGVGHRFTSEEAREAGRKGGAGGTGQAKNWRAHREVVS